MTTVAAWAPGRVNLIGDHTDHTGGWCFPIAIERGVAVTGTRGGDRVRLVSDMEEAVVDLALDVPDPSSVEPPWGRYVAGVVAQLRPSSGVDARITSTLPVGVGLSSSAALEVAVALALGADPSDVVALARLCQAAEHAARGVPTGLLDQLASIGGVAGCGLLIDCTALDDHARAAAAARRGVVGRRHAAGRTSARGLGLRRAGRRAGPRRASDRPVAGRDT